ncbi:MAG TPA: hypothetical protein VJ814_10520 [Gaiellaceae bacterium]|nr:hypothetical protein [Gaiellaceae bacterium]
MRRILLSCACFAVLTLPAAASAGARGHARPGFLVVRKAAGDGGVHGHAVVTVVIEGFVLGRVTQEAQIDVYQLPSSTGEGAPQPAGPDVRTSSVRWHGFAGKRYIGSGFRFRAMGGTYRVVVRGAGVYLFAGGQGRVTLVGSSVYPRADGAYSVDGGQFRSLPARPFRHAIGGS